MKRLLGKWENFTIFIKNTWRYVYLYEGTKLLATYRVIETSTEEVQNFDGPSYESAIAGKYEEVEYIQAASHIFNVMHITKENAKEVNAKVEKLIIENRKMAQG